MAVGALGHPSSRRRHLSAQGAIHGRPRDREHLRQITDGILPGVIHAPQLLLLALRQLRLLAPQLALGAGHSHALTGPHPDLLKEIYQSDGASGRAALRGAGAP